MVICAALSCKNFHHPKSKSFHNGQPLTFHRFPNESERCRKWVLNCGRRDLLDVPYKSLHDFHVLCSVHFVDKMFMNKGYSNRLTSLAVPTLFDDIHSQVIAVPLKYTQEKNQMKLSDKSLPSISYKRPRKSTTVMKGDLYANEAGLEEHALLNKLRKTENCHSQIFGTLNLLNVEDYKKPIKINRAIQESSSMHGDIVKADHKYCISAYDPLDGGENFACNNFETNSLIPKTEAGIGLTGIRINSKGGSVDTKASQSQEYGKHNKSILPSPPSRKCLTKQNLRSTMKGVYLRKGFGGLRVTRETMSMPDVRIANVQEACIEHLKKEVETLKSEKRKLKKQLSVRSREIEMNSKKLSVIESINVMNKHLNDTSGNILKAQLYIATGIVAQEKFLWSENVKSWCKEFQADSADSYEKLKELFWLPDITELERNENYLCLHPEMEVKLESETVSNVLHKLRSVDHEVCHQLPADVDENGGAQVPVSSIMPRQVISKMFEPKTFGRVEVTAMSNDFSENCKPLTFSSSSLLPECTSTIDEHTSSDEMFGDTTSVCMPEIISAYEADDSYDDASSGFVHLIFTNGEMVGACASKDTLQEDTIEAIFSGNVSGNDCEIDSQVTECQNSFLAVSGEDVATCSNLPDSKLSSCISVIPTEKCSRISNNVDEKDDGMEGKSFRIIVANKAESEDHGGMMTPADDICLMEPSCSEEMCSDKVSLAQNYNNMKSKDIFAREDLSHLQGECLLDSANLLHNSAIDQPLQPEAKILSDGPSESSASKDVMMEIFNKESDSSKVSASLVGNDLEEAVVTVHLPTEGADSLSLGIPLGEMDQHDFIDEHQYI